MKNNHLFFKGDFADLTAVFQTFFLVSEKRVINRDGVSRASHHLRPRAKLKSLRAAGA